MKNILVVFLFLTLSVKFIYPQDDRKEVKETAGGFSYSIPADWTLSKIDGMDYQIARDKMNNGFFPNITVYQEKNAFSFDNYYRQNLKQLKDFITDYKEIKSEDFTTDSGLKGKKHICSDTQVGKNLMQVFYFFEKKDKTKIIITGSSLIEDKDDYIPVFDKIVKSFKLIKK